MLKNIIITGDIHNDFGKLNALISRKRPELVLCCGDFGYWEPLASKNKHGLRSVDTIKANDTKVLWCDGNHEHFWGLKERKSDEVAKNVFYMPRGSTFTLPDGRVIMFMGGGYSIDKMYRTEGRDWFPEETISHKDMQNLPDVKVDIFITHTCSTDILLTMLKYNDMKNNDPSNLALTDLWEKYMPTLWYFGHWHVHKKGAIGNGHTKWECLADTRYSNWWTYLAKK